MADSCPGYDCDGTMRKTGSYTKTNYQGTEEKFVKFTCSKCGKTAEKSPGW